MVIEFIGATGAGKTTLIRRVLSKLAKTGRATDANGLVTGLVGLRTAANPTVQNVIQEIVGLPFFGFALGKYRPFIGYTMELFSSRGHRGLEKFNNLRSLERKLAVNEIIRLYRRNRFILVDEGPILVTHMFAFAGDALSPAEIERFAALVPLPELVVYVRAPIDVLLRRTLRRSDRPRQLKAADYALMERYARSAVGMFDRLVNAENIRRRLITVETADFGEEAYEMAVDQIAGYVLRCGLSAPSSDRNVNGIG